MFGLGSVHNEARWRGGGEVKKKKEKKRKEKGQIGDRYVKKGGIDTVAILQYDVIMLDPELWWVGERFVRASVEIRLKYFLTSNNKNGCQSVFRADVKREANYNL